MLSPRNIRHLFTVLMVIVVVAGSAPLSGLVGTASAATAEDGVQNPSGLPTDQVFEGTDNGQIEVWDRFLFPLRTDDTGADTQVPQPSIVQGQELDNNTFTDKWNEGGNSASLKMTFGEPNPMGVHGSGSSVTISFDDDRASAGTLDGLDDQDDVEFVAAKLEGSGDGVPSDVESAIDILSSTETANENASFTMLKNEVSLGPDGNYQFDAQFSTGQYIIYAAVHENSGNGFETGATDSALGIPDDNISVDGDVALIGIDHLSVHQNQASVTAPSSPLAGENLSFDVDTTSAFDASEDGSVTHVLTLFNTTTYEESRWDFVVDDSQLAPDFDINTDSQLETSIGDTVGVANVEDGINVNGVDLSDGKVSKTVGLPGMIDFIAEDIGTNNPDVDRIDQDGASNTKTEILNASITARSGENRQTTINVDTFGNFSEGEYRFVLVSMLDDNSSATSTTTGTLTLGAAGAVAELNKSSMDFGEVGVTPSGTSKTIGLKISSTGNEPLDLKSFSISGSDAGQFAISSGGSTGSVSVGSSRTVKVAYTPTAQGSASATLSIGTNDAGKQTIEIPLSGTGTRADINVTSTVPIDFTASTGQTVSETVTIRNDGNIDLSVTSATIANSQFTVASTSGIDPISPGSTGTVTVDFTAPNTAGNTTGTLALASNDDFDSTRNVRLSGQAQAPEMTISPSSIGYGTVNAEKTTYAQAIIENTGSAELTGISASLDTDDEYSIVTDPSSSLSPGSSTTVNVSVAPDSGDVGSSVSDTLTISSDEGSQDVSLSADAEAPEYDGPGSKDLGSTPAGSATQDTITLSNTGEIPLNITDLSISAGDTGAFAVVGSSTPFTIGATSSKTITLAFTPSDDTAKSATLTVSTNDTAGSDGTDESSVDIDLDGDGTAATIEIQGSSTPSFGRVGEDASTTQTVTIENVGDASVTSLSASGGTDEFSVSGVSGSIGAGNTDDVTITYTPGSQGDHQATLQFTGTDAGGSTVSTTVIVNGTGVAPQVKLNATSKNFGVVDVDAGTTTRTVKVSNIESLDTSLSVTGTSISGTNDGAFTVLSSPSSDIQEGGSDTITVEFDPSSSGSKSATLTVNTDDPSGGSVDVSLTGTGSAPQATLSPAPLSFGNFPYQTSQEQNVTISNSGGVPMSVDSMSVTGSDSSMISITNDPTPLTLVPGESAQATISVTLRQTSALQDDGAEEITVSTNASSDPTSEVRATPDTPNASPSPSDGSTLSYGDVNVGSGSLQTVTIENTGDAPLRVSAPSISGNDPNQFSIANNPGAVTIGVDESFDYSIAYQPSSTADHSASLEFSRLTDPDTGSLSFTLDGSGVTSNAQMSDGTVAFGKVQVGSSSSNTIALQNEGGSSLDVSSISLGGNDPGSFSYSGIDTSTSVSAGGSQSFTVKASPSVRGTASAELSITTADGDTVTTILGVTGTEPNINVVNTNLGFTKTLLGSSDQLQVTIENNGNAPLEVDSFSLGGTHSGQFALPQTRTITIEPKLQKTVPVVFQPDLSSGAVKRAFQETASSGTLTIGSNDTSVDVSLSGQGITPAPETAPSALKYGTVSVGTTTTRTVTFENKLKGTAGIEITSASIQGRNSDAYSLPTNPAGTTLAPGGSTDIDVELTPSSGGTKFASLVLSTNDTRIGNKIVFLTNSKTVVSVSFGSVTVDYTDPVNGVQPTVNVSRGLDTPASLKELGFVTSQDADFNITAETQESAFENAEDSDQFDSVRYLNISQSDTFSSSDFTNATFTFRVSKAAVKAAGVSKDQINLYHYDSSSGEYTRVETRLISETLSDYVYEGVATSFSEFSIGASKPSFATSNHQLSTTTVNTGENFDISVDVTNSGDASGQKTLDLKVDGSTVKSKTVTVAAGATKTVTFTHSISSTGDFTIAIDSTTVGTVTVESPGDGGGGGGGGGAPAAAPEPEGETFTISVTRSGNTSTGTINNLGEADTVSLDVNQSVPGTSGQVNVERVNVTAASSSINVQISVTTSDAPPAETPDLDKGGPALGYIDVQTENLENPDSSPGEFTFRVSQRLLDQRGVSPDNVVLYRYSNGSWNALETTHLGGERYRSQTPGFSAFAIGTEPEANIEIQTLELGATEVDVGDSVDLSITVENSGDAEGTIDLDITVDGDTRETRSVTVPAGESVTETATLTFDDAGTYDIGVSGESAGSVEVTAVGTATPTTPTPTPTPTPGMTPTDTPPGTPPEDDEGPGLLLPVIIVLVLVIAAVAYYFREEIQQELSA